MSILPSDADKPHANNHPAPLDQQTDRHQRLHTQARIQAWLVTQLSELLALEHDEIDVREPFENFGLSSRKAVGLSGELEQWLGHSLPPTLLWEYPSIEDVARHLAELLHPDATADPGQAPIEQAANSPLLNEPIAIIGIGCRFPGAANSPAAFWKLLRDGVDGITEVPGERWDSNLFYDPDPLRPGKMNTRWGGFVEQIDQFDPAFFSISPREAAAMDPQQRLLLEVAWEALEHAGQTVEALAGSQTGVFIGIHSTSSEYSWFQLGDVHQIDTYTGTGNSHSVMSGRLSYLFDLRGPSLAVDTACSSSLVAIHLACQSLRTSESTMALAGGVNLILAPQLTICGSKMQVMAPDGRCKTFDARADGFVRSEGCGVVVLKRLSDAQAAGDPILAVIRGSAINQDGHTNGLTAPNVVAQQAVIRQALEQAQVAPDQISYIETHGTGTALGDPIEVDALKRTYGQPRDAGNWCALGSVKANVGHLEAAAGVAGLIKAVLALRHQAIPPQLHFQALNPNISLTGTPFRIPTELVPWSGNAQPRRASVSSFGWSGTNAHVVLEEAPAPSVTTDVPADNETYLLTLSARSLTALQHMAQAYKHFLETTEAALADVCYTASVRRSHHDHRLAVVGVSAAEIAARLQTWQAMDLPPGLSTGHVRPLHPPRVVFVVPGQGAQWIGMARQLLAHEPVFQQAILACAAACQPFTDWDLVEQLTADPPICRLDEIDVLQPTLFAIAVGLAALWQSWGVQPAAVIGHSMGEVAAAYVAGALTLDDAARIICTRSRLLRQVRGLGAMATVELSLVEASEALTPYTDRLAIAASNSPHSTVIAGDPAALDALLAVLEPRQIFCQRIKVDVASHSPQMDPLCAPLRELLAPVQPRAGSIPIYSTVEEAVLDGATLDADYWVRNLREPVRLAAAVERAAAAGMTCFIELSPHPILLPAIERTLRTTGQSALVVPSLRRGEDERSRLRESLGLLYCHGVAVAWSTLYPRPRRCVALPAYPWQRERCWVAPSHSSALTTQGTAPVTGHPLLGPLVNSAVQPGCYYAVRTLSLADLPYLTDHRVQQQAVLPATGYVELALASAQVLWGPGAHVVEQMAFVRLLGLHELERVTLQVVVQAAQQGPASVQIFSRAVTDAIDAPWTLHATGEAIPAHTVAWPETAPVLAATIQARCPTSLPITDFYAQLAAEGLQYGPSFQGLVQIWRQDGEALGEVGWTQAVAAEATRYGLHPALLDACLHTLRAALPEAVAGVTYVPIEVAQLQVLHTPPVGTRLWVHAQMLELPTADTPTATGRLAVRDADGQVFVSIERVRLQRLAAAADAALADWLYVLDWQRQPRPAAADSAAAVDGSWLIFSDGAGPAAVGPALAEQLTRQGVPCTIVAMGAGELQGDGNHYRLDPTQPDDFRKLLKTIHRTTPCRGVIYLWSLTEEPSDPTAEALMAAQTYGCQGVLHLVQALAQTGWRDAPRLWLVTRGTLAVGAESAPMQLAQAPIWGLARAIMHEHPELHCTRIDLAPGARADDVAELFAEIWERTAEDQVALRADGRYIARLMKAGPEILAPAPAALREDGAYLITGGLGGIGLLLARWLVEQGARHLVLLGRRPPSEAAAATLEELATTGASLTVRQVDVADPAAVSAVLDEIAATLPPLRGVFHAAGVLDDATLLQLSPARFQQVLAPKLIGAWTLHTLTRAAPLDYFVLFSSAAALLGSPAQGNYAAANAFLDALAHARRAQGLPALSINWGPWAEVGLAAAQANRGERLAHQGIGSLTPEQGITTLARLLQQPRAQVAVLALNVRQWRQSYPKVAKAPLFSHLLQAAEQAGASSTTGTSQFRDRLLAAEAQEQRALLESHVREQIAQVLRLTPERIGADIPFTSLGFDSLIAIELRNRLEVSLGLTLPATLAWTYPTLNALVPHLAGKLGLTFEVAQESSAAAQAQPEFDEDWSNIDQLSQDELAELLFKELESIEEGVNIDE